MTWCWHPKHRLSGVIREEDYRCCCHTCTAKCGFITLIILDILGFISSLGSLVIDPRFRPFFGSSGGVAVIMIILGLLAIGTLKPIYMQIYWIFYIVQVIIAAIFYFVLLVTFVLVGLGLSIWQTDSDEAQIAKATGIGITIAVIAFIVVYSILLFWRAHVTRNFYLYVRDRQLAIEQQPVAVSYVANPYMPA